MISIFFLFVFSLLLLQVTSNYMKKEKKINAIMTNYLWNNEVTYMALETVLENLEDIDKVYIICPFTDKAKKKYQNRFGKRLVFFDETSFPFQSQDIFDYMMEVVKVHGVYPLEGVTPFEKFLYVKIGWFLQQLLKLYAGRVIGLEDYLVLDADVFWFNKVNFINETIGNMTRYNYASSSQYHQSYMASIGKLSGDEIYYKEKETFRGGITHHMVFTKHVLNSIFEKTEKKHKLPFWKAVLNVSALEITCHAPRLSLCGSGSTLSEYDLYLNHAKLYYPETINYRPLLWTNGPSPGELFWPPLPDPKLHTDRAKPNWLGHKSEEGELYITIFKVMLFL